MRREHAPLSDDFKRRVVAASLQIYARLAVEYCGRDEAGALLRGAAADAGATLRAAGARDRAGVCEHGGIGLAVSFATLAILAVVGWSR